MDAVFDASKHRVDDIRAEAEGVVRDISAPRIDGVAASVDSNLSTPIDTTWATAEGYRIQINTSPTREQAESVAEHARQRFPYDSVYVYFNAPWHKVRVGDLETRLAAEEKMREARNKGYRDAFWVRSEIRVMEFVREDDAVPFVDDTHRR